MEKDFGSNILLNKAHTVQIAMIASSTAVIVSIIFAVAFVMRCGIRDVFSTVGVNISKKAMSELANIDVTMQERKTYCIERFVIS
jgi:hypothetical protein